MSRIKLERENTVTVYAVKCKDGHYLCVQAISWKDCKRHCGSYAVSIRKRQITCDDHLKAMIYGQPVKRAIYETGRSRAG